MEVRAHHRNIRMSARKIRVLRGIVRGLPVAAAEAQLQLRPGKAAAILLKVLKSAVANAQHNFDIEPQGLAVADLVIDSGFSLKRYRPASRGSAHPILRRTAHVTVVLEETGETTKKKRRKRKVNIETITPEELFKSQAADEVSTEVEQAEPEAPVAPAAPRSVQEEATQKVRMMQQGGDKHKSHRRKSLGN